MNDIPADGFPLSQIPTVFAAERGESVVARADGETLTWDELDRQSNAAARGLLDAGVDTGAIVTLLLPNSTDLIVAVFACYRAGAIPQVLSARSTAVELDAIIALGKPAAVVEEEDPATRRPGSVTLAELRSERSEAALPVRVPTSWKAPVSGGSTGRPKIILSGRSGVTSAFDPGFWQIGAGSHSLITAPMHHNAPFATALTTIFGGGQVTMMSRFDAEGMLACIDEHRPTWVYLVPTMMRRIWALPEEVRTRYRLDSVDAFWHCAEPCPEWLKHRWIDWLGAERIWELYAGTESEAGSTIRGDEWLAHPGSVGRVTWGEMRIIDGEGRVVSTPGQSGEIVMRVTPGTPATYSYIGAEAETVDGWTSLGDTGRFDDDGYLYLHDRRSDMVTVGGVNVYPAEVEAALVAHDAVLTAAVIGLPDERLGNRVHAIVQVPAEAGPTECDLQTFLADRLSRHKLPSTVEFVHEPLRDDAGKVRRSALRKARLEGTP